MNTGDELNDLLKGAMQFEKGDVPEPNPAIHKRLRKKIKSRPKGLIQGLTRFLNLDIKLYQAGIAIATTTVIILLVLKCTTVSTPQPNQNIIVADTNVGSTLLNDSFLVHNFSVQVN